MCVGVSAQKRYRQHCEVRSCPWPLLRGYSGILTCDPGSGLFTSGLSPKSLTVNQAVGSGNCYESNFFLSIALLSSIPTNNRGRVLINVVIMQGLPHFHYIDKFFLINPASS